jgi:hypothetical protein
MRINATLSKWMVILAVAAMMVAPVSSFGQSRESTRRQQTKNTWRNVAIGAAAVGVYGLLKGDKNLAIAGGAGAAYGAYRYEQDRKSQSRIDNSRYGYYGGRSYDRYGNTQYGRDGRYSSQYGRYDDRCDDRGYGKKGSKGQPKGWSQGKGHGYGRVNNPRYR